MANNKFKSIVKKILIITAIILAAFTAGIFGEFFTRAYLSKLNFFRDFYFASTDLGQRELVINEPKKVVIEQDLQINQLKSEIKPSLIEIYRKKIPAKTLLDKVFLPDDYLGQAVVLTSDGWLLCTGRALSYNSKEDLVIYYNQKLYDIDEIVKDNLTDIIFLKINIQNLSVMKLADLPQVTDGQQILIYDRYYNQLSQGNIINRKYKPIVNKYDFVNSSQSLNKYILLNKNFSLEANGSPVFNLQGEVIGMLDGLNENNYSKVIPINFINPIINQVLKGENIKRPYLGINYLNLNQIDGLDEQDRQGQEKGIMIWPDKSGVGVMSDSPLNGQLVKGDIILSIENQTLDENNDLLDLLLSYKTGQEIRLKYLHEQKEAEISFTLK